MVKRNAGANNVILLTIDDLIIDDCIVYTVLFDGNNSFIIWGSINKMYRFCKYF